ncbi:MAG: hypothetical protein K0S74_1578 [Chlamydiales bacterium]|jgi:hypothetical protein|nr:hypothetical protein [Chlamydiales bacterium]
MKNWIDLAIEVGRRWQSPQTNWIHYCPGSWGINEKHDPIPLYENALWALALLRSSSTEERHMGKAVLVELLAYQYKQGEWAGNFPVYMHQYGAIPERWTAINWLIPLYWAQHELSSVFRDELELIKKALELTLEYCLRAMKVNEIPPYFAALIMAVTKVYKHFNSEFKVDEATLSKEPIQDWLNQFEHLDQYKRFYALQVWQLLAEIEEQPQLKDKLKKVYHEWDRVRGVQLSSIREYRYWGTQNSILPYDIFLKIAYQVSLPLVEDISIITPVALSIALIRPINIHYPESEQSLLDNHDESVDKSMIFHSECLSYLLKNNSSTTGTLSANNHQPLNLFWGDQKHPHSLVCEVRDPFVVEYKKGFQEITLFFHILNRIELSSKKSLWLCSFFADIQEQMEWKIEGQPATIFKLQEKVTLSTKEINLNFVFEQVNGNGRFFGHLLQANRPGQLLNKGSDRFKVFDWMLGLRVVELQDLPCTIKCTVSWCK